MSYANVLASAGVVGAQYRTARDAGVTLSNLHFAPADVVAAAHGVNNAASLSDAAGSGIAAAKASLAFLEAVVTKVPALGTALSLASLGINLQKLHDEWAAGEVSAQTAAAVLGDLSAIGGVVAVAAIAGPAGLALGIALSAISAGLTRIFHRSRATNEYGIALVCPKIQVSNLDQRAGNAEAKLYRRN